MNKLFDMVLTRLKDPLYHNSLFFMGSGFFASLLGYLFWVVAAKYFSSSDIGLITSLLLTSGLLATFSKLGFDHTLIRFLYREPNKKNLINTAFTLTFIVSFLIAIVFIAGIKIWSPAMTYIYEEPAILLLFLLSVPANAIWMLLNTIFGGMRKARLNLVQSIIAGLMKIPLPAILVSLGLMGLLVSAIGPLLLMLLYMVVFFLPRLIERYSIKPTMDRGVIAKTARYSISNYAAETFDSSVGYILPVLITNMLLPLLGQDLSASMSAYFFFAWTIYSVITSITMSISMSLLAELSYDSAGLNYRPIEALKLGLLILVPIIVIVYFFGDIILNLYGKEYAQNALTVLRILAFNTIPVLITRTYVTIKRAECHMRPVLAIYIFIAIGTLTLSSLLIKEMGITGVALAYLCIQLLVASFLIVQLFRRRWLQQPKKQG